MKLIFLPLKIFDTSVVGDFDELEFDSTGIQVIVEGNVVWWLSSVEFESLVGNADILVVDAAVVEVVVLGTVAWRLLSEDVENIVGIDAVGERVVEYDWVLALRILR